MRNTVMLESQLALYHEHKHNNINSTDIKMKMSAIDAMLYTIEKILDYDDTYSEVDERDINIFVIASNYYEVQNDFNDIQAKYSMLQTQIHNELVKSNHYFDEYEEKWIKRRSVN